MTLASGLLASDAPRFPVAQAEPNMTLASGRSASVRAALSFSQVTERGT